MKAGGLLRAVSRR